jgi:hypothetical protein
MSNSATSAGLWSRNCLHPGRAVGSAPASSSIWTTSSIAKRTAQCKGVPQSAEVVFGSRPLARRNLVLNAVFDLLQQIAEKKRLDSTLAPYSTSRSNKAPLSL